jgi:hypothetical protein
LNSGLKPIWWYRERIKTKPYHLSGLLVYIIIIHCALSVGETHVVCLGGCIAHYPFPGLLDRFQDGVVKGEGE